MGLDTTHGCWHGAYSAFMRWRIQIAKCKGIPLMLMEGFFEWQGISEEETSQVMRLWSSTGQDLKWLHDLVHAVAKAELPLKWESLRPDPIHKLLHHSDCDGELLAEDCAAIADSLEECLPLLPAGNDGAGQIGNWKDRTATFIDGLRLAASRGENVEFH